MTQIDQAIETEIEETQSGEEETTEVNESDLEVELYTKLEAELTEAGVDLDETIYRLSGYDLLNEVVALNVNAEETEPQFPVDKNGFEKLSQMVSDRITIEGGEYIQGSLLSLDDEDHKVLNDDAYVRTENGGIKVIQKIK